MLGGHPGQIESDAILNPKTDFYSTSVQGVRAKVNQKKTIDDLKNTLWFIPSLPPCIYCIIEIIIEIPCCTCASDWTSALIPLCRSCNKATSWIFLNVWSSGKRFHFVWKAIRKFWLRACCCSSCEQRHRPYPSKGTRRDRERKKILLEKQAF